MCAAECQYQSDGRVVCAYVRWTDVAAHLRLLRPWLRLVHRKPGGAGVLRPHVHPRVPPLRPGVGL